MSFLYVDKSRCGGDGKCVRVCPSRVLEMDTDERIPRLVKDGQERCIRCGHCVAVCPHAALSLEPMRAEDCTRLEPDWRITPHQAEQLLKGRRSIRHYKDQAVDNKTIDAIIDIARYAPSGVNRQPVNWAVINDKQKVHQLAGIVIDWIRSLMADKSPLISSYRLDRHVAAWDRGEDWICRGAPSVVVTYAPKEDLLAPQESAIALTYFELAAVSYGLGTCWGGYVSMSVHHFQKAREFLGFSGRVACLGVMMLGYPALPYFRIPGRNKPHVKII